MEVNFLHNTVFLFVPLCPDGTQWPRSNGCSALLSQTSYSLVIIRRSITHTGGGEGTSANSLQLPRCKSRRKSRSQLKAKPSLQTPMCASMARLGRAMAKSQRSRSAPMEDQLGTRQICLVNRNQTPGDFGNSIGQRPARRESERS